MKKEVLVTGISLACLVAGFALFIAGIQYSLVLSLIGIFIYLYLNKKKKE